MFSRIAILFVASCAALTTLAVPCDGPGAPGRPGPANPPSGAPAPPGNTVGLPLGLSVPPVGISIGIGSHHHSAPPSPAGTPPAPAPPAPTTPAAPASPSSTPAQGGSSGGGSTSGGQCNVGKPQCCESTQKASTSIVSLSLLKAIGQNVAPDAILGLTCTGVDVLDAPCHTQTVCCENNTYNGLINIGCSPIDPTL
ncbi:hypothetical protein EUX98_g6160 [Antrodiella citrinella]|uniref:Hydrophobin n=1 Tax=Antrodiella citrinella TaxID=2447956 RepID=A0A4S4MX85_9APHY|nr:hypothetical protein EUX98_g6160 [Antrodiella citrinella]